MFITKWINEELNQSTTTVDLSSKNTTHHSSQIDIFILSIFHWLSSTLSRMILFPLSSREATNVVFKAKQSTIRC